MGAVEMFQNLDGAMGILLADDDEVTLQSLGRLVGAAGHAVNTGTTTKRA